MINSGSINSFAINGTADGDAAVIVSELIEVIQSEVAIKAVPAVDSITVSATLLSDEVVAITEAMALSAGLTAGADRSIAVTDDITLNDVIRIALNAAISENITEADTVAGLLASFHTVLETVAISDPLLSQADQNIIVASAFTVADLLSLLNVAETVSENLTIDDTVLEIFNAAAAIAELINPSDQTSNSATLSVIHIDDITLEDVVATVAGLHSELSEDMVFIITLDDGTKVYQGITLNPETFAVSEYDNYSFNSTTNFQGNYLLASPTGLFSMGGDTDDGAYITAKLKTASLDFGTSSLKQVPKMYLGINNDASLILRVSIDSQVTATYQLDIASDDLSSQVFDIGKGLKGRNWQFELQTKGNSTLEIDEMEFFPIQWGRKR